MAERKKQELILVKQEFAGRVDLNEYFKKLLIEAINNDPNSPFKYK